MADYPYGTLQSVKGKDQTLYDPVAPVVFQWKWEDAKAIPADSQFVIQLSLTEDFSEHRDVTCAQFNPNVALQYESVWNLMTSATYYWRLVATLPDGSEVITGTQTFTTVEAPRLINVDGVTNFRDLGGWETGEIVLSDGTVLPAGKTTQGLVYRSARLEHMTAAGVDTVLNELGIRTEIELRPHEADPSKVYENAETCPALLESGRWNYFEGDGQTALNYAALINNEDGRTKLYLLEFTKPENYPIIVHCSAGADRTGSMMFILNALQGVSEADLIKDYELTTDRKLTGFYSNSLEGFPNFLIAFHKLPGNTPYEKARYFCEEIAGLTPTEVDCIIQYMRGNLDYTP